MLEGIITRDLNWTAEFFGAKKMANNIKYSFQRLVQGLQAFRNHTTLFWPVFDLLPAQRTVT